MESLLLVVVIVLTAALVVVLVGFRSLADRQFRRWRQAEIATIRAEQRNLADEGARLQLSQWQSAHEGAIRQDAISRSASVIRGKVSENLTPYMPAFPFNPRDARFVGSPVDLVVFDGLEEGAVRAVVFIEVKTGGSQLSARQRQVRDAVEEGRIAWQVWRLPAN